ncbi:MAG: hypothetical protein VB089_21555, partial [Anaerolineaceae bacterium]|nr:hypothetical protein [Anaerolineaceae bacterium]
MKLMPFFRERLLPVLLLALAAVLAYLPLAHALGFYFDDWYLIYAGHTQGAAKFVEVFAIDRPARALLVAPLYSLFGDNAPLYSYSACLVRWLGAVCLWWLVRMVWPRARSAALVIALLFVVYPGFMDQPNAIDYQSHIFSLTLALFSLACTVRFALAQRPLERGLFAVLTAVTTLAYLLLIEYHVGLEALRVFLLWVLAARVEKNLVRRAGRTLLHDLPALLALAGFLFWRVFLFDNQRSTTAIDAMFFSLVGDPLYRGLWMLARMVQDFLNVSAFAWAVPLYNTTFNLRLSDFMQALLLGLALAGAAALYLVFQARRDPPAEDEPGDALPWQTQVLIVGALTVVCTLLPVHFGSRHVQFPAYSRFSLPGSIGAAMLVTALLYSLPRAWLRIAGVALLAGMAVMAHFGNAVNFANEWDSVRHFWWQVAWRAPGIQAGTTLVADYPISGITEDYFLWGPANLIYFPQKLDAAPTPVQLPAALLTPDNVRWIELGYGTNVTNQRSMYSERNFANVLALSMPTGGSCVHLIEGQRPELSDGESYEMMLVASHSNAGAVRPDAEPAAPPQSVF